MTKNNLIVIITFVMLIIATSGCVESTPNNKAEFENVTLLHSIMPFYTDNVYEITPGCYEVHAETLTPESDFVATVGTFSYKISSTDRFGNQNEEWEFAPAPRLNSDDPAINLESKVCGSDKYTICNRRLDIAPGYIGDTIRGLEITTSCKGDCKLNISHCD